MSRFSIRDALMQQRKAVAIQTYQDKRAKREHEEAIRERARFCRWCGVSYRLMSEPDEHWQTCPRKPEYV